MTDHLKHWLVNIALILVSSYGSFLLIGKIEHEKLLALILAYILPALFLFFVYYKSTIMFYSYYIFFFLLQTAVYIFMDYRWEHGLFLEQDSMLFIDSFDFVSVNPIQNYYGGHSNGALYLSIVKAVSYIFPLPLSTLCVLINALFMLAMMARLQRAINIRYEINSIWAMKYLAVSPLVHCFEFVALKDIMTMSLIGIFLSILLEKGPNLKLLMLSLAIALNRVLIGVASLATLSPIFAISLFPLLLYVVSDGTGFSILSAFLAGGESDAMIFPLSTIKFILTPLPHTAVTNYPSQFPLIFHIPLTLMAAWGFIKYSKIKSTHLLVFVVLFLLISHFSPGNVRYRLMFEPFLALGFSLFMHNRKKIKGVLTK